MRIIAGPAALPHALNALPAAAVVAVLCALVIAEIVALPGVVLPGGTITLLAGALIGSGRPALGISIPVAVAVIGGDHLAYRTGSAVTRWWRRRRGHADGGRGGRHDQAAAGGPGARGRAAGWLTAAMPSLAGAARMPYRCFTPRLLAMRLPWLAGLLSGCAGAAGWPTGRPAWPPRNTIRASRCRGVKPDRARGLLVPALADRYQRWGGPG